MTVPGKLGIITAGSTSGVALQVFKVQPEYARDVWDTGPALATNLQDVQQTCRQAADGLRRDSSNAQLLAGLSGKANRPFVFALVFVSLITGRTEKAYVV